MLNDEKIYIGIDVSKALLDVFILPAQKYMQFSHDAKGIEKLVNKLGKFGDVLVVM